MATIQITQTNITTAQFLNEIHGENTLIYFNIGSKTWQTPRAYTEELHNTFKYLNTAKNQDIYFIVNSGGTKNTQINKINSVFIDWDCGKDENGNYFPIEIVEQKKSEFLPKLSEFPFKPTFVVETRNGYHIYWLLYSDGVTNEQFIYIQKKLAHYFNSDSAVYNPARVMRLPGYYWIKNTNKRLHYFVNIINAYKIRYFINDIIAYFSNSEDSQDSSLNTFDSLTTDTTGRISAPVNIYINKEYTRDIYLGTLSQNSDDNVVLSSDMPLIDYLKKQNIADYLKIEYTEKITEDRPLTVKCQFHDDSSPSASIYIDKDTGYYMYCCHSEECEFYGSIVDVAAEKYNVTTGEAVRLLIKHYKIEEDNSWEEKQNKILENNIEIITNIDNYRTEFSNLYKVINRVKSDLLSKLVFAKNNIKLKTSRNELIVICALSICK